MPPSAARATPLHPPPATPLQSLPVGSASSLAAAAAPPTNRPASAPPAPGSQVGFPPAQKNVWGQAATDSPPPTPSLGRWRDNAPAASAWQRSRQARQSTPPAPTK